MPGLVNISGLLHCHLLHCCSTATVHESKDVGATAWLLHPECNVMGATSWVHRRGCNVVGAALWVQRCGCNAVGAGRPAHAGSGGEHVGAGAAPGRRALCAPSRDSGGGRGVGGPHPHPHHESSLDRCRSASACAAVRQRRHRAGQLRRPSNVSPSFYPSRPLALFFLFFFILFTSSPPRIFASSPSSPSSTFLNPPHLFTLYIFSLLTLLSPPHIFTLYIFSLLTSSPSTSSPSSSSSTLPTLYIFTLFTLLSPPHLFALYIFTRVDLVTILSFSWVHRRAGLCTFGAALPRRATKPSAAFGRVPGRSVAMYHVRDGGRERG